MIITNLIYDKTSTKPDLSPGQTWLNITNNIAYLLTYRWGFHNDTYALVDMMTGVVLFETTNIKKIFWNYPNDFKQVGTELVIRELI